MSLSAEEFSTLSRMLEEIAPETKTLNAWERGFVSDQQERLDKYGAQIFLSRKQWAAIRKIHQKATGEVVAEIQDDGW